MSAHSAHVFVYRLFLREEAISLCSDMGKEANGVRPRWLNWNSMSLGDINEVIDQFADQIEQAKFDREDCAAEVRKVTLERARANRYRPNNELAIKLGRAFMRSECRAD